MDRLRQLREDWKNIESCERDWFSDTTPAQRVAQLVDMYGLFRTHIEETEELFGPERRAAMIELQRRLGYQV